MSNSISLISLILSVFIVLSVGDVNHTPDILKRLNYYADLFVFYAPPYVWGGYWGIVGGGDCSGQMRALYVLSGVGYPRLTSRNMWNGGWPGLRYKASEGAREETEFPHLIFFDYSPKRPRGHVGIVRTNVKSKKGRRIVFAEASSSAKIFKETLIKQGDYRWRHVHGILIPDLTPGF